MEEFLQKLIGGFVTFFHMVLTIQGDAGFRNHPPYHGIDYISQIWLIVILNQ